MRGILISRRFNYRLFNFKGVGIGLLMLGMTGLPVMAQDKSVDVKATTTMTDPLSVFIGYLDKTNEMILQAFNLVSIGYKWGGETPEDGFDCSGFIHYLFKENMALAIPRSTKDMKTAGERIDKSELRSGDLVFFNTRGRAFSHVGLYVGEGRFVHAPRRGGFVRIESMETSYWASRFNGARRVIPLMPMVAMDNAENTQIMYQRVKN